MSGWGLAGVPGSTGALSPSGDNYKQEVDTLRAELVARKNETEQQTAIMEMNASMRADELKAAQAHRAQQFHTELEANLVKSPLSMVTHPRRFDHALSGRAPFIIMYVFALIVILYLLALFLSFHHRTIRR